MSNPASNIPLLQTPPSAGAPADFIDIRGPIAPDFWTQHGSTVLWGCLVLLVATGLLWWLVRRWLAGRRPPPTPAQIALAEIQAAQDLFTGDSARYSAVLSQAVRRYIEQALRLPAPERTTEEFLLEARSAPILRGEPVNLLGAFLEGCDLAKFARQTLDEADRARLAGQARAFVEGTELALHPPKENPSSEQAKEEAKQ